MRECQFRRDARYAVSNDIRLCVAPADVVAHIMVEEDGSLELGKASACDAGDATFAEP
jgi:hypothetical protein